MWDKDKIFKEIVPLVRVQVYMLMLFIEYDIKLKQLEWDEVSNVKTSILVCDFNIKIG